MIYIIAFGFGLKCSRKIYLNTLCVGGGGGTRRIGGGTISPLCWEPAKIWGGQLSPRLLVPTVLFDSLVHVASLVIGFGTVDRRD